MVIVPDPFNQSVPPTHSIPAFVPIACLLPFALFALPCLALSLESEGGGE